MVSLTQLQYLLAVEKHRHFGKAAKACHITQPTLSQQIQKLEDELSIIIFDRIKKPILPTPEGKRFLDQAQLVLREHQKLIEVSKRKFNSVSGDFKLGIIPTVATYLIPLFIESFSKDYPDAELQIEELKTESIIEALHQDKLDGAILSTPIEDHSFKVHPIYYEPFALYLSSGHELLKKTLIKSSDIDQKELWLLKDGNCFKTQIAHFCSIDTKHDNVLKNIHFQSSNIDTLCHVIQKNKGYTLIPQLLTSHMNTVEIKNHVRFFTKPVPSREISFIYRRDHWKLEMIEALKKSINLTLPADVSKKQKPDMIVLEAC